jgi:hypothetical protein
MLISRMIYLIITTCLNIKIGVKNDALREKLYRESIGSLMTILHGHRDIKPIIVENNGPRSTYLDTFGCDVLYTNNNVATHPHKGVNELNDIKAVISAYRIGNNDVIIKLTGRYRLLDDSFLQAVKANMGTYDAFVKFFNVCTLKFLWDDCVLGLFAIKCKYLKEFTYACKRSPECEFAEYVRNMKIPVMEFEKLNMFCCFGETLRQLVV